MMDTKQTNTTPLLEVKNLGVDFFTPRGTIHAIRDTSFELYHNEVLGIVGESGCGKSTVSLAIMGYLQGMHAITGDILFEGKSIIKLSESELRKLRGDRIAMVYQDPVTSLNPTMKVGVQVEEILHIKLGMSGRQSKKRAVELFASVGLPDPENIGKRFPHQLSGGMQQRIVIAMALACEPDLLIMDEPTTGLDVTTEATILDLVVDLKQRVKAGIIYVSHNLGVIARVADRVAIMYAGQIVEKAKVRDIFKNSKHPYTIGLLNCVPQPPGKSRKTSKLLGIPGVVYDVTKGTNTSCLFASRCPMAQTTCQEKMPPLFQISEQHQSRCFFWQNVSLSIWGQADFQDKNKKETDIMLEAKNLRRFYGRPKRKYIFFGPSLNTEVRALVNINFHVRSARTLGIVGESGSGKTTIAKVISGLTPRDKGDLLLDGKVLAPRVEDRDKIQHNALRMVFQNPTASLNPQRPISYLIVRSLRKLMHLSSKQSHLRTIEILSAVGLSPSYFNRLPGELSGGEQQRVALAAAFAGNAELILADEAVSALDVSVQAQVLNLLESHQQANGTAYVFISHDLGVVRYLSDDIVVLYAGHIAESGPASCIFNPPSHPYTEALLSAAPVPDPDAPLSGIRLYGSVPTMREKFTGCFFVGRCPRKIGPICEQKSPPMQHGPDSPEHVIYCHIPIPELVKVQKF